MMKIIQQNLQPLLAVPAGSGAPYFIITTVTALLCLLWVSLISLQITGSAVGGDAAPVMLASMGAAAVLMFAAPGSPMAKPWAFAMGNLSSAIVGVTIYQILGDSIITGPVAVAVAIGLMHVLRCQHPPGGATALVAVIGGDQIHALGYSYVLMPVAINVAAFMLAVILHRRLLAYLAERRESGHRLNRIWAVDEKQKLQTESELFQLEDIKQALKKLPTYIDASPKQLHHIFQMSLQQAQYRKLQHQRCGECLSAQDATTDYGTSLLQAWKAMCEKGYDYLVVVNKAGKVEGQITAAAIIAMIDQYGSDKKYAKPINIETLTPSQLDVLLKKVISPSGRLHSDRPEVVGQLMQPITLLDQHQLLSTLDSLDDTAAVVDVDSRFIGCLSYN